eukprot:51946-Pelagomonas_calceolata.AAC.1
MPESCPHVSSCPIDMPGRLNLCTVCCHAPQGRLGGSGMALNKQCGAGLVWITFSRIQQFRHGMASAYTCNDYKRPTMKPPGKKCEMKRNKNTHHNPGALKPCAASFLLFWEERKGKGYKVYK